MDESNKSALQKRGSKDDANKDDLKKGDANKDDLKKGDANKDDLKKKKYQLRGHGGPGVDEEDKMNLKKEEKSGQQVDMPLPRDVAKPNKEPNQVRPFFFAQTL